MEQEISVSIICNVYNHGAYLRDTLDGFVSQKTNFAYEILIHDDASTDDSAAIIREYEARHPHIVKPIYQTVNQYSQNVAMTKTFQLPRVKGKYIATCEGDDYWTDPEKLQKQFDFMESHPEYTLCSCSTDWYNVQTGIMESRGKVDHDRDISLDEIILEKHGRIFQYASNFVRAETFLEYPDWMDKFPIGDYPLIIQCGLRGKVHMLADTMSVYRYFAANSWSARMDSDERRAKVSLQMIEGLKALDEATEFRYSDTIRKRINKHRYTYAIMTHDLKALRSGDLKQLYYSRNIVYRASDVLRCKFPKMYRKVMKPLARVIKSVHG